MTGDKRVCEGIRDNELSGRNNKTLECTLRPTAAAHSVLESFRLVDIGAGAEISDTFSFC